MTAQIESTKLSESGSRARAAMSESRTRQVRAPFSLRCGALLIDYTLIAGIVAFATLIARMFGGGARMAGDATVTFGLFAAIVLTAFNFIVWPAFSGQTLGKWATGLRIERQDGAPLTFARALVRHTLGYLFSMLTLGFGFLLAIFDRRGRALHDRLAGTAVVRELNQTRARRS